MNIYNIDELHTILPEKCRKTLAIIFLTFNSERVIEESIRAVLPLDADIWVIDSGSQDGTMDLLSRYNVKILKRPFINYSDQRNWAIEQIGNKYQWQLHLDADEVVDKRLIKEVLLAVDQTRVSYYLIRRRDYFMGKMLKHSGVNPWHCRLFKSGFGVCEQRLYDQHFVGNGKKGKLIGYMHDINRGTLSEWVSRHNRWSDSEAKEAAEGLSTRSGRDKYLHSKMFGDGRERARFAKNIYYRLLPPGVRPLLYFLYRYFLKLGFLDGRAGLYYCLLQGLFFRALVDAKIYESEIDAV